MDKKNNIYDEFEFCITDDKSVGLYNKTVTDVYHSKFGAKSEAKEKFIKPLNFEKLFFHKKELNILDICYGIGYNSKAFINKILQVKYKGKIQIDLIEKDIRLPLLSPFIKDTYFDSRPEVSYIILNNLFDEIIENKELIKNIMIDKKNKSNFTPFYLTLVKKYDILGYKHNLTRLKKRFLHNIYYHCISQRHKSGFKHLTNNNISIKCYFDDARNVIKSLNDNYDIVFLDAFTPAKLPTLWTYDFFKVLYSKLNNDCLLITYSNSAAVRKAMLDCGFHVGKIYDTQNRSCGTYCSKNEKFITNKLSSYDLGLLNTGAGVYYRDESLNKTADEIIEEHALRKKSLNLQSSSSYIKQFKNN